MSDTETFGHGRRRPVQLVGAVNLRDIGGYPVTGGGRVRYGRIYRSDSFADLHDSDLQQAADLGLRTICDLRHQSEREAKPNRELPGTPSATYGIGFLPYRAHEMVAAAREPRATPDAMREDIREAYRRFVSSEAGTYAKLFDLVLVDDALPLLVHCTSGKDRTGVGIAILLMALGVPDDAVVEDYLLSNRYRRDLSYLAGTGMRPEMLDVMMEVHPSYLQAALDEIDRIWGTRDHFFAKALGLTASKLVRLRTLLVEQDAGWRSEQANRTARR